MQNKGAIRFFAIALTLVCLYQLSFTWITKKVENDAKEFAGGDVKLERVYLDSISNMPVYNLFVKNFTYKECQDRQLNLGLDLKGGMNVTLEVSVIDLIRSMANNSQDTTFNAAIAKAMLMQQNSQADFVTLFGQAFESIDANAKLAAIFATRELQDKIQVTSTNQEVLNVIRTEAEGAIDRSFNILRTRIDKFGVTQPNIQQLETSGRILVELPGITEPERVRKLLQGTAKLEFWETYEYAEVYQYLASANEKLRPIAAKDTTGAMNDTTAANDSTAIAAGDTTKKDTSKSLLEKLAGNEGDTSAASKDSSKANKTFEDFAKENPLFAVLRPMLTQDEKGNYYPAKGPVVGYASFKDTSKVNALLVKPNVKSIFPRDLKFLWTVKPYDKEGEFFQLVAIKVSNRDGKAPLEGDVITDARKDFGQSGGAPEISMSMNPEGAKVWKRLTGENKQRSIAIVLDDYVYSFPTVQNEIAGGNSSITGNFTINEADDLANILKAGKLPAPARIVSEEVVGPSLGQEAISAGMLSFVISLLLVLLFMGFYYSTAGWVADLALFANIFFVFGVLASLSAVLTLPGIAGIVLTIGMSVDANILIFERVREELAAGNRTKQAIKEGFAHAMSSIIDSNVTNLLLGIILYVFGTGPIQGFATTLIIGILTSLFAAIFITRLVFETMMRKDRPIAFDTKITRGAFKNIKIDFVAKRKLYYAVSGVIVIAGIVSMATRGLNLGVDFKGGRTYVVRFEKEMGAQDVRSALTGAFGTAPEVKTFGPNNQFKVTTPYLIDDNSIDADHRAEQKLRDGLSTIQGNTFELMSSQKVGKTVSDDIQSSAVWAILLSMIVMFIYILIRFKKWQYSLGSVVALFHDVMAILACYSIFYGMLPFSLEIDQAFIAAILTVMGYSMNDTVVVFDRIREYISHNPTKDLKTTINSALNSTLSRTINTSVTIFFVLLAIFIFGGEVIRGFSFALLIGIIVGTYSSICIATPIVIDFYGKQEEDKKQ